MELEPQGAGPEGPDPRRGLSLGQEVCSVGHGWSQGLRRVKPRTWEERGLGREGKGL